MHISGSDIIQVAAINFVNYLGCKGNLSMRLLGS